MLSNAPKETNQLSGEVNVGIPPSMRYPGQVRQSEAIRKKLEVLGRGTIWTFWNERHNIFFRQKAVI